MIIHKGLTIERWSQFSLAEQLANVGTDVERAIRWKEREITLITAIRPLKEHWNFLILRLLIKRTKKDCPKKDCPKYVECGRLLWIFLHMITSIAQPLKLGKSISIILVI